MDAKGGNGGAGIGGGHDGFYEISIYGGTIKAVSEANAAGIGGGEEGKAGEVSLYGGRITATAGETKGLYMNQLVALAIGHGILGIDPKVTISDAYSHLLVKKDGEIVGTTFRVSTCKTTGTVELMPCYHKMTWLQTDFYQKHRGDCAYCDYHTASEDHIFENGECTVCGYKGTAGEGVYKVTVYKAPTAQGTGYDGGTTYIVAKDNDFEVPYIYRKDVPDDMVFMDWKQVTNDNDIPETWEMKDGETLVESGSAIKIAADTKLYARYRYQYVETWDWAADYSSATLHIECGNDVQAPAVTVSSSVMTDDKTGISYTEYVATATYERAPGYTYTFTDTHTVPLYAALTLSDDEDNTQTIAEHADPAKRYYVMLCDRTLYKDGSWNTLCLPFDVENLDDSPLAGATVKALSSASFANSTLTLNFADVIDIEAGRPYLIKWFSDDNIVDPVFTNVTIQSEVNDKVCDIGDAKAVTFKGTYKKLAYETENRSILFLGGGNTLYFPQPSGDHIPTIGAQRAYFQLTGITAGDPVAGASRFVLNFDGEETTSLSEALSVKSEASAVPVMTRW